jgi:hypothetical protein
MRRPQREIVGVAAQVEFVVGAEGADFDEEVLDDHAADPDDHKRRVILNTGKDVVFVVDLAAVQPVEELHEDEGVEDDG